MENKNHIKLLTVTLTVAVIATLLFSGSLLNNAFSAGHGGKGGNGAVSLSITGNSITAA